MEKLTPNKEQEENIGEYLSELGVGKTFQTQKQRKKSQNERTDRLNHMDQSAGAAKTKYHRLGGLKNRNLFLSVLEAGSSRSRCQSIQFLVRALFLACRQQPSCCVSTWPFLSACVRTERERERERALGHLFL